MVRTSDCQKSPRNTEADFWSYVIKSDVKGACWEWNFTMTPKGYGTFSYASRPWPAHRLSYYFATGDIPSAGLFVCHTCDNRKCVNPDHLYPGTVSDNARDMCQRGRAAKGARNGRYTKPWCTSRGEGRPAAKLNWEKVREIRGLGGTRSQRQLAKTYGVSTAVIWHVLNNRAWIEGT